jgi:chromosome segregation protein
MYLQRIRMQGFKSFADKAEFEFARGVTGVVGPNGCGKSNVVDAYKWALGEQSAKSLRGRQMQDMIFNGSSTRRSSGMAQVDLIFENRDRVLPIDTDEVVVTRKLYRSGESEYLLCKQAVRLKDIRELFLDTGVGTEAYSVIEQGKVDILLQSSPTERRIIFDEAAGISKYKIRKRETERRLERTQQNLLRVEDIIQEVEKRLRSVKYQAGKARSYQAYQARLTELRAGYAMAEFHHLTGQIRQRERESAGASDEVTALRTRIDANESEASRLTAQSDTLAEQLRGAEAELIQVKSEAAAYEERGDNASRRMEEQQAHRERTLSQLETNRERCGRMQTELHDTRRQADELAEQARQEHLRIERLSEEDQRLGQELTHVQALLEDEKAGIIELLRRTARLHNEMASVDTHRESLVGRKGELSQRDAAVAEEMRRLLERKAGLEGRLVEVDELIQTETRRLEEKKTEAQRVSTVRARLVEELAESKEHRSGLISRRQLLEDLEKKMEGVGAAVRRLLERKAAEPDRPGLEPVRGLVADAFDAHVAHAAVVEAAIGELDQHLVVSDSGRFLADADLFDHLPSRLTALCLDRLPPVINRRDFSDQPGFVARALDLVRVPEPLERLATHLLAKTVVVQTLNDAMTLASQDNAGHRFVTLAGQVVEPDGCIRLGPPSSTSGLISRRSELRVLDEQIEAVTTRIEGLAGQSSRAAAEAAHLDELQHELRTAIYESHATKIETNAGLQNVVESIERLTAEQPLIAGEVALLERQIKEAAARAAESQASLGHLENENEARQAEIEKHQQRIDDLVARRSGVADQRTQARVTCAQLTEKQRAAAETIESLQRLLRTTQEAVETAENEVRDYETRIEQSKATIESCRGRAAERARQAEQLEANVLTFKQQREQVRAQSEDLAAATKTCRSALAEAEDKLHAAQMALNEARVRRDDLCARVADELGLNLVDLYESYDHAEQDWAAVEAEIQELRGKIERLGHVNLDAIAEQDELEQRCTFLSSQRDDLNKSHRELEQLIRQLNAESKRRFREAFEIIRENFRDVFRKLFAGGRADIILEDPEEVLDCGIEIVARPPGKELQSISLLSGGEKALTAIALLLGIFRSRPAPFAILDEVDAALDEANNNRFNCIVQEFLDRSQFILITHSKRTMTIADRLFGVTMQEPGVSTPVSVKFDREESTEHAVA